MRRAVIGAATELFAWKGIDAVRLRDVAQAADVHPALIGRHIGTKDDLVNQVFERVSNDVAASVADHPLAGQGFAPGSLVWTWARIASALVISGRSLTGMTGFNPVTVLASTLQDAYGVDPRAARLRASQIVAAALGWRLFEDYLIEAGGLGDVPLGTVRDELTRSMRRLGATPWPSPADPTPRRTRRCLGCGPAHPAPASSPPAHRSIEWMLFASIVRITRTWSRPPYHG